MNGWMDEQQTGQNHHKAWLSPFTFFLSQLVKVHDNTKTTSQDFHLLIHDTEYIEYKLSLG